MDFIVYLSSTMDDLKDERQAVKDALGSRCRVKESYDASEQALVAGCLDDVSACDLYIGILGLRYGYVPKPGLGNPENLSITELEYQRAVEQRKPRLVFVKDSDEIKASRTDAVTGEHPIDRIKSFRARASEGEDQRPAVFTTAADLKWKVERAFADFVRNRDRASGAGDERGGKTGTVPPSADAIRNGYVNWLREECEKVVLLGLDLRDRQNVRLGQVYVPALTTRRPGWFLGRENPDESSHEPLLHRLGKESVYVPGAPGSGKSTFCRWLALSVAAGEMPAHPLGVPEEFDERFPTALAGRFPFYCQLRQWASDTRWLAGKGQWVRKQLEDALAVWVDATSPGGLTSAVFRDELTRGRAIVILDGVDEIPEQIAEHYPRRNFLTGLADALPHWTRADNRVLLTSRPYGVEDAERRNLGLAEAGLAELPRALQHVFMRRWYAAARARDSEEKAHGLIEHLDGRPDLAELRPNPMLLTALCVKYDEDLRLPGDLYRLYSAVTEQVLYKRFTTEPERDLARLRLSAVALAMHQGSAGHPRSTPAAEVSFDEVDETLTVLAQSDGVSEQSSIEASAKREVLLSSSGMLLPRANKRAAFYHLSFQEFLAAVRLKRVARHVPDLLRRHAATAEWRRTLRFLFCAIADQASPEQALDEFRVLLDLLQSDALARDARPALLLSDCLEVGHARGWNLRSFAKPYRDACDRALTVVPPPERAYLWQILGHIGLDDRKGVGTIDGLPDIDWVDIPEGQFQFGKERAIVSLPAFRIARYPVTNAQFQCFIDDGGFETDAWWRWPERRRPPSKPRWSHPNHPRETVSWFEATAFCVWLGSRLHASGELPAGRTLRLPTEQEWEKAARGTDGREYPWGERYESGRANIDETDGKAGLHYLQATTAVGIYPGGVSPYDVHDLTGNVWEWGADARDRNTDNETVERVLRGGSWFSHPDMALATRRDPAFPDLRNYRLGFRLVSVRDGGSGG